MTPAQIEGMIDRICGMYAAHNVSRNSMKGAWTQDDLLLDCPVEKGREVLALVEQHGKIPSLPEIKSMIHRIMRDGIEGGAVRKDCTMCGGSGWWDGITNENPDGFGRMEGGVFYRFSRMCPCRN
jgi:hypothetical protein